MLYKYKWFRCYKLFIFSFNYVRKRGHNFKLYLSECRFAARKFSFVRHHMEKFKILFVNAVSLNSFKCKMANVCLIC